MSLIKRFGFVALMSILISTLIGLGCSGCVEVRKEPSLENYKSYFSKQEKAEKRLTKYIVNRTVRVITYCKVVNLDTGKVVKKEKEYGWGTGAILVSARNYSYIQTANHVVDIKKTIQKDNRIRICRFGIERRDVYNRVKDLYKGGINVVAVDKNKDIAVLKIPHNFGVNSKIAATSHIGQDVKLIGFPALRGIKKAHLSYGSGKIATLNMGTKNSLRKMKYQMRIGIGGYFGNSGGAVWNNKGELVGVATLITGFRTLGGFVPQQDCLYGPGVRALREFYLKNPEFGVRLF